MEQHYEFSTPQPRFLPAGNKELLFGLLAVLLGLFAANMILFGGFRLGFAIAAVLSIALSWWYLHSSGCKVTPYTAALLALSLVIAAGFGWSADSEVKVWLFLFLIAGVNLAFCLMAGKNVHAPGSARSLMDAAGTFFLGIEHMGMAGRGVVMAFRAGGAVTQRSGAVLAGLGIALPALIVVIPLLISSDAAFEGLVGLLPDFDLFEICATVIVGAFLGVYLYTRAVTLRHEEPADRPQSEWKGLQKLTMNTALGAICFVYMAYLISQLAYFVGGFSGILPEGFTRAEYARRGFFEMTCLAGINLCLMTFGVTKVQRDGRAPGSTRALCLFLGAVTEFLAASSAAKMILYINTYGLTRLRVLTMVIMVFLGLTTALICVWLYVPKLQYMKSVMLIALVLGAAVLWADVDTQVAKYNVRHYLSGDLSTVDMAHLFSLGAGAVPYMEELTDCNDPELRSRATAFMRSWALEEADDFRELTWINHHSQEIVKKWQNDDLPPWRQQEDTP